MTSEEILALGGSVLTFFGGVLLVVDTFSPVRHFLHGEGRKRVQWLEAEMAKLSGSAANANTAPATDQEALSAAKRSQYLARGGFILITLGFMLDLLAKLHICQ